MFSYVNNFLMIDKISSLVLTAKRKEGRTRSFPCLVSFLGMTLLAFGAFPTIMFDVQII